MSNVLAQSENLTEDILFGLGGAKRSDGEVVGKINHFGFDNGNFVSLGLTEDVFANTVSTGQMDSQNDDEFSSLVVLQGNALIALANPSDFRSSRSEIIDYVVKVGDTPSSIASSFEISTDTILWANNLKDGDYIRPGDTLVILPVSGIRHKVVLNDSIEKIAKKYYTDTEKIIAFNGLPADGTIKAGQDLIVPDGKILAPKPKPQSRVLASSASSSGKSIITYKGQRHHFPYGYCTYYVATRRNIPWSGHAKSWLRNARVYGFATGTEPRPGSIVVTKESWYGHVAIVEKVYPDRIVISEMNHLGWAKKSVRVLSRSSRLIRGYIY